VRELFGRLLRIHEAYWLRAEDRIFYVSPAFDDIFGRPREESSPILKSMIDYVYEDDKQLIN
jgi:PAS domain-containing protein